MNDEILLELSLAEWKMKLVGCGRKGTEPEKKTVYLSRRRESQPGLYRDSPAPA